MDGDGTGRASLWLFTGARVTKPGAERHIHIFNARILRNQTRVRSATFCLWQKKEAKGWMGWAGHMGAGWEASEANPTDGERLSHVSKWENTF